MHLLGNICLLHIAVSLQLTVNLLDLFRAESRVLHDEVVKARCAQRLESAHVELGRRECWDLVV